MVMMKMMKMELMKVLKMHKMEDYKEKLTHQVQFSNLKKVLKAMKRLRLNLKFKEL